MEGNRTCCPSPPHPSHPIPSPSLRSPVYSTVHVVLGRARVSFLAVRVWLVRVELALSKRRIKRSTKDRSPPPPPPSHTKLESGLPFHHWCVCPTESIAPVWRPSSRSAPRSYSLGLEDAYYTSNQTTTTMVMMRHTRVKACHSR